MKKWLIVFSASFLLLLSGCSLINDAKNLITYIDKSTDYLAVATDFANEAPALAQKAVENQQAAQEFETMLQEMQQEIDSFNGLQAPELAADLHQQIVEKNNAISTGIDLFLNNIENGKLDPAALENLEVFQTALEISSIIDQIKQLGE